MWRAQCMHATMSFKVLFFCFYSFSVCFFFFFLLHVKCWWLNRVGAYLWWFGCQWEQYRQSVCFQAKELRCPWVSLFAMPLSFHTRTLLIPFRTRLCCNCDVHAFVCLDCDNQKSIITNITKAMKLWSAWMIHWLSCRSSHSLIRSELCQLG